MTINNKLKLIVIETIDEALQSILGGSGKEVVYHYLQNSYGLKKETIPENIEAFIEFLNNFFGYGAKIIEKKIIKNLCIKLEINTNQIENITLTHLIKKIESEQS